MIAVVSKRGWPRTIAASSKPSTSGMRTSISMTAMGFFSRCSNASVAEPALMMFSPNSSRMAA